MFNTLIFKPIFNLLTFIYAIIPGHNFGLAIIIFTIVVRLLMWPLVKKQLHHAKAMKALTPELKRIKKEAKGDRQKESMMTMALYKEKGINPLSTIGVVIVQLPILLALYAGLNKIIHDPHAVVNNSYGFIQNLGWMKELAGDISKFAPTNTLLGIIDLGRPAIDKEGAYYGGAMLLAVASAVVQYFQSKQLLPNDKEAKSLRTILKSAKDGDQADQSEINAAVGRVTSYFLPGMLLVIAVRLAAALPLYWTASGLVAYLQQARVLKEDEEELEDIIEDVTKKKPSKEDRLKKAVEAEIVKKHKSKSSKKATPKSKTKSSGTTVVIRGPGAPKS